MCNTIRIMVTKIPIIRASISDQITPIIPNGVMSIRSDVMRVIVTTPLIMYLFLISIIESRNASGNIENAIIGMFIANNLDNSID